MKTFIKWAAVISMSLLAGLGFIELVEWLGKVFA